MAGASLAADIEALTPSQLGGVGGLESPPQGAATRTLYMPDTTRTLAAYSATLTDSGGTTGGGRWRPAG